MTYTLIHSAGQLQSVKADFETASFSGDLTSIDQTYVVNYGEVNSTAPIPRSGNPGYIIGESRKRCKSRKWLTAFLKNHFKIIFNIIFVIHFACFWLESLGVVGWSLLHDSMSHPMKGMLSHYITLWRIYVIMDLFTVHWMQALRCPPVKCCCICFRRARVSRSSSAAVWDNLWPQWQARAYCSISY